VLVEVEVEYVVELVALAALVEDLGARGAVV